MVSSSNKVDTFSFFGTRPARQNTAPLPEVTVPANTNNAANIRIFPSNAANNELPTVVEQTVPESTPKPEADSAVPVAEDVVIDATPSEVTEVLPVVRANQSVTIDAWSQISQEHPFDNAERLNPADFPNQPHKENSPLPVTISNILHLLKMYGIQLRYNVIKKKLEVICANLSTSSDNRDTVALTIILSLVTLNRMSTGPVPAILETIADRNPYNPVADWIMSKPWDGVDRLQPFQDTLVERKGFPKELKNTLVYRWLISAVAAALKPTGFYGRGILTLQGKQSMGKTSWIRALVPDPILREQVLKLDHHLDAGNKDTLITALSHWLVEIGELDSSLKKDIARLKGFITGDRDKLRKPYGRADSEYQRRTVFCASVNDHAFLVDPTGNTRFWTVPVTKIDYQHTIDMQQLFAQIAIDFQKGEPWWLNRDEELLLEKFNNEHRAVSVIRERLLSEIDLENPPTWPMKAYTATAALQHIGVKTPTNQQCKEAGGILREFFSEPKKIQGSYKWRIPFIADKPGKFDKLISMPDDDDLY